MIFKYGKINLVLNHIQGDLKDYCQTEGAYKGVKVKQLLIRNFCSSK